MQILLRSLVFYSLNGVHILYEEAIALIILSLRRIRNILNIQDLQPYHSTSRKAYNGKLLAFVRVGLEQGNISVSAKAEGLEGVSVSILVRDE